MHELLYPRKILPVYCWMISSMICSLGAIFFALIPPDFPNVHLVFYGFAVVCCWQTFTCLSQHTLYLMFQGNSIRHYWIAAFACWASLLVYAGILNIAATLWLAPRSIIQDILGFAIYTTGLLLGVILLYYSSRLKNNELSLLLKKYLEKIEIRKAAIQKWNAVQQPVDPQEVISLISKDPAKAKFCCNVWLFFVRRLFYMIIWIMIPLWLFTIIPLQTFSTIQEIPWPYQLGTIATVIGSLWWIIWLVYVATTEVTIFAAGFVYKRLFRNQTWLWQQIQYVYLENDWLRLYIRNGQIICIPFLDIIQRQKLWQELQKVLPLAIFFINDEGWRMLQKNLTSEDMQRFQQQYDELCTISDVWPASSEQKKKKKK